MKKILLIASLATSLLVAPIINTVVPYTVIAAEVTSSDLTFLDRLTITPDVPKQSVIGQETTIDFTIDWKNPADINVLQAIIKVNGNAELISIGNNLKEFVTREDGTFSYINDELQKDTSFPVTVKITGAGPVSIDAKIAYSDAVGEEEQSTTLELNVVEDSRSLEEAKKESIGEVNKLSHLSKQEKEDYIDRIQQASNLEEIASSVSESIAKNRELSVDELNKSKEEARKKIDSFDKLTKEQKEDFSAGIELATNLSETEALSKTAQDTNDEKIATSEFSDKKIATSDSINGVISVLAIVVVAGIVWIIVNKKR